jgi:hypothetical protein
MRELSQTKKPKTPYRFKTIEVIKIKCTIQMYPYEMEMRNLNLYALEIEIIFIQMAYPLITKTK